MKTFGKILLLVGIIFWAISCRNEDDNPKIEKIEFESNEKRSFKNDTAKLSVFAEPQEAKKYDTIEYWAADSDIVEILQESDNDNVVFRGLKAGKTVIRASVNGMAVFCSVTILGGESDSDPYIVLSNYVMVCEKGETQYLVASLVGGNPQDEADFAFSYTGQDKNIVSFRQNSNVGVFKMENEGESVVTVSHPKAQFSVISIIFVKEKNEAPVYITTDSNVISLNINDAVKEFQVNLFGAGSVDLHLFRYNVKNGSNVIGLNSSNNVGSITPKMKGIAQIEVSHQNAQFPIEITVIVNAQVEYKYIDVDNSLIVMNEGDYRTISVNIAGDVPDDHVYKYSYVNSDNTVIQVSESYYMAGIRALKKGSSVIKIKNDYVDFEKEVLVIVNGPETLIDQEKYITTNQNVITTEVNGEALLSMTLAGGNSADANNFIWTVDDGSIIEITSQHGEVRYKNRAAIANADERFEAVALIKAKKIGIATITLENPKANNTFSVTVKVYKQGVYDVVPVVIDGPAFYRIEAGKEAGAFVRVAAGLERNFTNVRWISGDENIFEVGESTKTSAYLIAKGEGIATLTVTGNNVRNDYTATVIVGSKEYLNGQKYIYAANPYLSVLKGDNISFRVNCVNMAAQDIDKLSAVNNSGNILEMFAYRNNILVRGLSLGEGEIIVSGEGLNTLLIKVMVEDYALTPEKPYYLRPEKFIYGVIKGQSVEISVDLVGGTAASEKDMAWGIKDSNVAEIKGSGKKCIITGKNSGQTVLTVTHYKSQNANVEIVIYVVLSQAELNSKVIVHVPEQNMLLRSGESCFISIITNAGAGQNDFRWATSNANVVNIRTSANKLSAFLDAAGLGTAKITVGYGSQVPQVVYVSVVSGSLSAAYINVPSIVEIVAGQTVTVNAVTGNIMDLHNINWESQQESIAKAYGNGGICTVSAYREGKAVIQVTYPGFSKDIVVRVYKTNEEMASAYVFAGEQSRYIINVGDVINVGLTFGIKGYPEHDLINIRWVNNDPVKIGVNGNGAGASVTGLAEGVGVVSAEDSYGNSVKIEIVVKGAGKAGKYVFSIDSKDRIKGILAGSYADIEVKVFNGTAEIFNVSGIEYAVENSGVIRAEGGEGGVRVYALPGVQGQSYITIKHDLAEDARILVYTALTEGMLANAFPIMIEKTNYLVEKGGSFDVTVETIENDQNKLRNISYGLEKNNGVISIQERNKKNIAVTADKEGSEVILVRYNAEIVQRVYVSVVEKGYGLNAGYMITESIIGLVRGQTYETRVDTDTEWGITWKSDSRYICEIMEYDRKNAVLRANWQGETLITVKAGDIERYIKVFVVENEEGLGAYNAINIEQRKYKIRKGDSFNINIDSYQGKVEGNTESADYYGNNPPYGSVLAVEKVNNGKLSVKGLNEGTAAIKVKNSYYNSEIMVYVEVYPAENGGFSVVSGEYYITAEKTLYIIDENDTGVYMSVNVVPEEYYGGNNWVWIAEDETIITVDSLGRSALVNPLQKGQTKITVSNSPWCDNMLEITVIVGERFAVDNGKVPYIFVEKDLFEVVKGSKDFSIEYNIVNVDNVILRDISFEKKGDSINIRHDPNNRKFNIEAIKTGIARLIIKYGALSREVYVLVQENLNVGNIYLTTGENYVVVTKGELRNIDIDLKGYDEIDSGKFKWSVSGESPKNVVQLVGNGRIGQIYGLSEGVVEINVKHERGDEFEAAYPLKIIVKVVLDKAKEKIVYLTTQRNVIETVVGSGSEMLYVQKVGGDVTKTHTEWKSSNINVAELNEINGYSARIEFKSAGVSMISVKNIEADYSLQIMVRVRDVIETGIYLESSETLIWLSPDRKDYRLAVDLVNGDLKDYGKIKWKIENQMPSDPVVLDDPNSDKRVISIVESNNVCLVSAVNTGTANIRVTCDGVAERPLILTVYVSHYKEIQFSQSSKTAVLGEMEIVALMLPTHEKTAGKAFVEIFALDGINPTEVAQVYFTNSLVLINPLKAGHALVRASVQGKEGKAEMALTVVERHDPNVNRINVSKNLHILNTRSGLVALNASVAGPYMSDSELDNITWEITRNYDESDLQHARELLDIMPKNVPGSAVKSRGRTVQITPKNIGNAIIRVSHPDVDEEYWKDIYVVVADMGNIFSINMKEVEVNSLRPQTVSVNILGGTVKDYGEVKWLAKMQQKWDGTMIEIVRVMGSGREVTLYPMNDGETEVYAFYNGKFETINVKVVSDYYFSFKGSNELMWPEEERDFPFEIRPASSNVNWIYNPDNTGPVVAITEMQGSGANPSRFLRVKALKEGNAMIVGMANGRVAQVNVQVKYDYEFVIGGVKAGQNYVMDEKEPKFEIKNSAGAVTEHSDGRFEVSYMVHPYNTYIKPVTFIQGVTVEIGEPEKYVDNKGRTVGIGTIAIVSTIETVAEMKFQQYKYKAFNEQEAAVESAAARPSERSVKMNFYFKNLNPVPYFMRGDGAYSNISNAGTAAAKPSKRAGYSLIAAPSVTRGEYMANSPSQYANSKTFSLDLGDGEEHYILFDRKYENAQLKINSIAINNQPSASGEVELYNDTDKDVKFTAKIVELTVDGVVYDAIRLSGGNDYIEYNRVAFDKTLYLHVSSAYAANDSIAIDEDNVSYDNIFEKRYGETMLVSVRTGYWTSFDNPPVFPSGQMNQKMTYFLTPKGKLTQYSLLLGTLNRTGRLTPSQSENLTSGCTVSRINDLKKDWDVYLQLYDYAIEYNYYTSLPEELRVWISANCTTVETYQTIYRYPYTVYRDNYMFFMRDTVYYEPEETLRYDNNGNIIGGYIYSYRPLYTEESLWDSIEDIYVDSYLYAYDKELIKILFENNINVRPPFPQEMNKIYNENAPEGYLEGWYGDSLSVNDVRLYLGNEYNDNYLYSKTNYMGPRITVPPEGTEKTTSLNMFTKQFEAYQGVIQEGVYLLPRNYTTPSGGDDGSYLNSIGMGYHIVEFPNERDSRGVNTRCDDWYKDHRSLIFKVSYNNIKHLPSLATYSYGSTPSGRHLYPNNTSGYALGSATGFFDGQHYFSLFSAKPDHLTNPITGRCTLIAGYHASIVYWYYSPAKARQWIEWKDTGIKYTVPYYIFNMAPFRLHQAAFTAQGENVGPQNIQYVGIEIGDGRPMPTISRSIKNNPTPNRNVALTVSFSKFNAQSGQTNDSQTITLNISCIIRACHSMYEGVLSDDRSIINMSDANNREYEGAIRDFSNPTENPEKKYNSDIYKYYSGTVPRDNRNQ
jgi:hypothetical protein